ncbi:MAG: DUF362 domain-containing protein [Armatimonadetes bacterium]|nr:DUF362 domain-containing protein [Armatimonadota bacterium]
MTSRLPILCALAALAALGPPQARAMPDPPGPAVVALARAERILVPPGVFAPRVLYPEGRVDFGIVERLVDQCLGSLTGLQHGDAWRQYVSPVDRVAILVDVSAPPVQTATVEVIIDRLVGAGVRPANICVFGSDERGLFSAGFNISHDGPDVRTYGADSEGYRGGMSRIVAGDLQMLVNLATLKADAEIGMAGCVSNFLACVPEVERRRLRRDPALVPTAAAHPAVRAKLRLNFLEAYLPAVDHDGADPPTVEYRGLIASTDPVAADTIGLRILQGCRDAYKQAPWPLDPPVTYLGLAQVEFRVGQADAAKISVRMTGPREGSHLD